MESCKIVDCSYRPCIEENRCVCIQQVVNTTPCDIVLEGQMPNAEFYIPIASIPANGTYNLGLGGLYLPKGTVLRISSRKSGEELYSFGELQSDQKVVLFDKDCVDEDPLAVGNSCEKRQCYNIMCRVPTGEYLKNCCGICAPEGCIPGNWNGLTCTPRPTCTTNDDCTKALCKGNPLCRGYCSAQGLCLEGDVHGLAFQSDPSYL